MLESMDPSVIRLAPLSGTTAADSFMSKFQTSTADVITLVGHNDHGTFKFPDGSSITLSDLGSGGPSIALISCGSAFYANGRAVGLPSEVTLDAAADIESAFVAAVNQLDGAVDVTQLRVLLNSATREVLTSRTEKLRYTFVVAGGGTVAVSITVIVWEQYPP